MKLLAQPVHRYPDEAGSVDRIQVILGRLNDQSGVVFLQVQHASAQVGELFAHCHSGREVDSPLQIELDDAALQLVLRDIEPGANLFGAAGCDLEADRRKLVGSAQARRGPALLQQNSLPLRLAHALKDDLFGAAAQEEARLATDLFSALGREPSFAEVRDAIVAGFRPELGIEFESGAVSADESAAAQKLRPAFVL